MGQATSTDTPALSSRTVTNEELLNLFSRTCRRQFKAIELLSIQKNMKANDKDHNEMISEIEFQELLKVPDGFPRLVSLLYNAIRTLSGFPLINHGSGVINFDGLMKSIVLLGSDRYGKVLTKEYDYLKLIFICFGIDSVVYNKEKFESIPDTQTVAVKGTTSIVWSEAAAVKEFDGIDMKEIHITAPDMLQITAFLLILSRLEPQESLDSYFEAFKNFDLYKTNALSILRSMNPKVTAKNIASHIITFEQFQKTITYAAPRLLNPLSNILEVLLYENLCDQTQILEEIKSKKIKNTSKLVNDHFLSQSSTFLPNQLVYSNIRKLYVGSDSGFSMRSFESKVFKWNAPTIMFISGTRINDKTTKNSRYKQFEEDYPKLNKELTSWQKDGERVTYGVYIAQPWKITNKESFGDARTEIFQISPIQKIFKPSIGAKHYVYFNTLGGGIGIGSSQPTLKSNLKRYNPGNVSLTVDSTLEFAAFRNLGLGGEFKEAIPSDEYEDSEEYEDRFLVRDVEVWGCGGEKELEEQNKQWEWEQREAKRRQGVNLKSIGEDRALLEMVGLVGQNQSGGSI